MATAHGLVGWTVGPLLIRLSSQEPFAGFTFVLTTRVRDFLLGVILDLPPTSTRLLYSSMIPTEKFRNRVLARQQWALILAGVEERTIGILGSWAEAESVYHDDDVAMSGQRFMGASGLDLYGEGNDEVLFGGRLELLLQQRAEILEEEARWREFWRESVDAYAAVQDGCAQPPLSSDDARISDQPFVCDLFKGFDFPCDCSLCSCHCNVCQPDEQRCSILRVAKSVDEQVREKERALFEAEPGGGDPDTGRPDASARATSREPAFGDGHQDGTRPGVPFVPIVTSPLPGFQNTGSSCWCNAAMQSLLLIRIFSDRVLELRRLVDAKQAAGGGLVADRPVIEILRCIADVVNEVARRRTVSQPGGEVTWRVLPPIGMADLSLRAALKFSGEVGGQQDASYMCGRFLDLLLGAAENAATLPQMTLDDADAQLQLHWQNYVINNLFDEPGHTSVAPQVSDWIQLSPLRNVLTAVVVGTHCCSVCKDIKNTPAGQAYIHRVFIPEGVTPIGGHTLVNLVMGTMRYDRVRSANDGNCCGGVPICVSNRFARLGDWLLIGMARVNYNPRTYASMNLKNTSPVLVPEILDADDSIGLSFQYRLRSVIVHHGRSAGSGHYTCFGRLTAALHGAAIGDRWCHFNDAAVSLVQWDDAPVRDLIDRHGVMFFYERIEQVSVGGSS